jgi:hypothetical protein
MSWKARKVLSINVIIIIIIAAKLAFNESFLVESTICSCCRLKCAKYCSFHFTLVFICEKKRLIFTTPHRNIHFKRSDLENTFKYLLTYLLFPSLHLFRTCCLYLHDIKKWICYDFICRKNTAHCAFLVNTSFISFLLCPRRITCR